MNGSMVMNNQGMTELSYKKIEHIIKYRILGGKYPPGQKLSSIRAIAKKAGCNPATVHRALTCLQRQEFIVSQTTTGFFVTADPEKIVELRDREFKMLTHNLYHSLSALGYSDLEIFKLIHEKALYVESWN